MRCEDLRVIRKKNGFSLIEIIFTLAVLSIGLGSLYGVLHNGMKHMRTVGGKSYAVVAATSEIEIVKAIPNNEFPDEYEGPFLGKVDFSALPDGEGVLKIEDHEDSEGRLRKVTVTITWTAAGKDKSFSVATLMGKPGE